MMLDNADHLGSSGYLWKRENTESAGGQTLFSMKILCFIKRLYVGNL